MIKGIIFDHDGVIADIEPLHAKADNAVLARYGAHVSEKENSELIGVSTLKSWELFKEMFKIPEAAQWLAEEKTNTVIRMIEQDGIEPSEGLIPLLGLLSKKGYKLAIASGQYRKVIDAVVAKLKISNYFNHIVSCEDVTNGKPAPDVFLLAARKLGLQPAECLVIEDSKPGITAAKSAGMACVALKTDSTRNHDLSIANTTVSSLSELMNANLELLSTNNKNSHQRN